MPHPVPFVSAAPHGEDVVLALAFGDLRDLRYLEITADPAVTSRCGALAGQGWHGQTLAAAAFIDGRGGVDGSSAAVRALHALLVDGPDAAGVLDLLDLATLSPWVVVVPTAAAESVAAALASHGYLSVYDDGTSRFSVAAEHAASLRGPLDRLARPQDDPLAPTDDVIEQGAGLELEVAELRAELDLARAELARWQTRAVDGWSEIVARAGRGLQDAGDGEFIDEVEAMRRTLSWRVTKPLRAARVLSRRIPFAR